VSDQFQSQPYPSGPYQGGVATASQYASWIQRVGAYWILDAILFMVTALFWLVSLAGLGWTIYNRWYRAGTTGQSLGKKVLNLRLVSEQTGEPIGPLMAFVRDICHIVDAIICYIGFLFPLWDSKRQTLADKIVKTVVISA
jgi:uncharacterized RDD family membrane protein YckC